jgi:lysophospholipase L1-like esterase
MVELGSPNLVPTSLVVRLRRLGWILACLTLIVLLLLLPPAWVPHGLLAGVTALMLVARNGRVLGLAAITLAVLVVVKQVYMPWAAWVAVGALVLSAMLGFRARRLNAPNRWIAAGLVAAWFSAAWMAYEYSCASRRAAFDSGANRNRSAVVCIGDSLTAFGYPETLATMIDQPVVDFGEDGITTVHGVKKLDEILEAEPRVVVIELGGHDYLKGWPRAEIKERLARMIDACQSRGAAVVLFEIPCGLITDPTRGVFREVAREHGASLIPDTAIRKLVFCSPYFPPCRWGWLPQLSDDGIHPNARGNQSLAAAVRDAIRELDLPATTRTEQQATPTP